VRAVAAPRPADAVVAGRAVRPQGTRTRSRAPTCRTGSSRWRCRRTATAGATLRLLRLAARLPVRRRAGHARGAAGLAGAAARRPGRAGGPRTGGRCVGE
jgi:hypothetical protein